MARKPIFDTPEYKLASKEMQHWAFTHKDNYVSTADAAKRIGMKTEGRVVKVKANNGEMIDVPVIISFHSISPSEKFKQARHTDGKFYTTAYMVKGSSPKNKTAIFFTTKDFSESEDVKALKKELDEAFRKFHDQRHEMLKKELIKSHPALAKKAAKELPDLVKTKNPEDAVFNWFNSNGFQMLHMQPSDFNEFVAEIKRTGDVPTTWRISAQADRWSHQTGVSGEIDFATKKVGKHGWSSDD